jgi:hypothetical protein
MKPIKNFGRFLVENTLFDPGTFEALLKNAISKTPPEPLYVEKQLSLGTISHMRMIAKKIDLPALVIDSAAIEDGGKSIGRFLLDEPASKTLVIFDNIEMANEKTIDFIESVAQERKINGQEVSELYVFAEVHLIDKMTANYKNDTIRSFYDTQAAHTQVKPISKDTI